MDKIIIIGNGFDRAHGLKTSYGDFIEHYSYEFFKKAKSENFDYEDPCIRLFPFIEDDILRMYERNERFTDWIHHILENPKMVLKELDSCYISDFIKEIFDNADKFGWVDIENIFFKQLFKKETINDSELITILNDQLKYLKVELVKYLAEVENSTEIKIIPEYIRLFYPNINKSDKICILNFNYTRTAKLYYEQIVLKMKLKGIVDKSYFDNIKLINIHGILDKPDDIIFGIGDEHHEDYKAIKEHDNLHYIIENSKSSWYLRNSNYAELMNFINGFGVRKRNYVGFDIDVLGHSCGLSDRTLLRHLFQHPKLNKIRLHYHKEQENFHKLTYDAWRHFDDSHQFRDRVEYFNEEYRMPQHNDTPAE